MTKFLQIYSTTTSRTYGAMRNNQYFRCKQQINPEQKMINQVVDAIGEASAIAQKLVVPVTTRNLIK